MCGMPRLTRRRFLIGTLASAMGPPAIAAVGPVLMGGSPAIAANRAMAAIGPLINIPQTWNNCGPASVAEVLAYWGIARTQSQAQAALRVDGPEAGMTPYGIPAYARSLGLRSRVGVGGTAMVIKALVAAGFPVVVHQVVSMTDPVGHWRPIEAFDDTQRVFTSSDPYLGPGHIISYADFATMWATRGNAFFVLYPASRQTALDDAVVAAGWNRKAAYARDLALLRSGRLDASPAGTPVSASAGYRYLGLAWDAAQLGQAASGRAYLRLATAAGTNPVEVRWISDAIG